MGEGSGRMSENRLKFKAGNVECEIELYDNLAPITVGEILKALPIESEANRWGDEIYFEIPVSLGEENSQEVVEKGEVAYWPPGRSLCIFFGKTPASRENEIRAASPVNVVGKVEGDVDILKGVKDGEKIRMRKIEG